MTSKPTPTYDPSHPAPEPGENAPLPDAPENPTN